MRLLQILLPDPHQQLNRYRLLRLLLAAYMLDKAEGETLPDYLDNKIFASCKTVETMADQSDIDGFNAYLTNFKACLGVEKAAIDAIGE